MSVTDEVREVNGCESVKDFIGPSQDFDCILNEREATEKRSDKS